MSPSTSLVGPPRLVPGSKPLPSLGRAMMSVPPTTGLPAGAGAAAAAVGWGAVVAAAAGAAAGVAGATVVGAAGLTAGEHAAESAAKPDTAIPTMTLRR